MIAGGGEIPSAWDELMEQLPSPIRAPCWHWRRRLLSRQFGRRARSWCHESVATVHSYARSPLVIMSAPFRSFRLCDASSARCVRRARLGRLVALAALALMSVDGLTATRLAAQSDDQAVIKVATDFLGGMRTRDTALMRSTVVPTTMVEIPGGTNGFQWRRSADEFIAGVGKGTGPGGDERMRKPSVRIDGPMASVWAYYTFIKGGETKIDHCGIDAFMLRKGPDGWKIYNISGTIRTTGCTPI